MLQQTTVPTVMRYFSSFIERFPNIHDLASASLDDVLRQWQGLGYYRRARMMHQCAQHLVKNFDGKFPNTLEGLRSLPGIGDYTAGAILAMAFQKRAIAIDGNVKRVISRFLMCIEPRAIKTHLNEITPHHSYGDFVQALIELGALVCRPQKPLCDTCPWQSDCQYQPHTTPRASQQRQPQRFAGLYIIQTPDGHILIEKRPLEGLWGGLYGFPLSDWVHEYCPQGFPDPHTGAHHPVTDDTPWIAHTLTHFQAHLAIYRTCVPEKFPTPSGLWVRHNEMTTYPLPTVFKKVLNLGYARTFYDTPSCGSADHR